MSKSEKTVRDIFDNMSEQQKTNAYELIGKALEYGDYMREVLVMFNKEERDVLMLLINLAMDGDYDRNIREKLKVIHPKRRG